MCFGFDPPIQHSRLMAISNPSRVRARLMLILRARAGFVRAVMEAADCFGRIAMPNRVKTTQQT